MPTCLCPAGRRQPPEPVGQRFAIVDLDGTLIRGQEPCDGAAELLASLGNRFVIASNNSTHSSDELSTLLADLDLDVSPDKIVLAGAMALAVARAEFPGARILLLGSKSVREQAEALTLACVDDRPDLVLLARDLDLSYDRMARAADAVARGVPLIVTNPDRSHPGPGGCVTPDTGCLLAALSACATPSEIRIIGKPTPLLFREAMRRLAASPTECVVIGDNPETDGEGARALGIDFLHVGAPGAATLRKAQALLGENPAPGSHQGQRARWPATIGGGG